jgi:CheY-like chemotaxis protein
MHEKPRILVVEPHDGLREVYQRSLSEFDVKAANDGASGLAALRRFNPHIVITPMYLSLDNEGHIIEYGYTGIDLAEALRKRGYTGAIVMVTAGNPDYLPRQAAPELGVHCLSRISEDGEFSIEDFAKRLKDYLPQ